MNVTYIHHSCFLVETARRYYLFDYFKGELPSLDSEKEIVVFASHNHSDHYDPTVFDILKVRQMRCSAYLSKDIPPKRYPDGIPVTKVHANRDYFLPDGTKIHTLLSTDVGVAFLIEDTEGTIYHAGDLNDWYWEGEPEQDNRQMTGSYRAQIRNLSRADIAFVVLDPRQEDHYADGMLYFLRHVDCPRVYPMHYWEKPEVISKFTGEYPEYQSRIHNPEMSKGANSNAV